MNNNNKPINNQNNTQQNNKQNNEQINNQQINTNDNNSISNNTINQLLGKKKKTKQGNKLDKLGVGKGKFKSDFKYLSEKGKKIVNVDNILMPRDKMVNILNQRKIDTKKGIDETQDTIYRQEPYSYMENMPNTIMEMDPFSINRNLRVKGKYYTVRDEINYYELDKIINVIKNKKIFFKLDDKVYRLNDIKYQPTQVNTYISQTLKYLLLNFLIKFNVTTKKLNVGSPYHQFTPYQIININIIKIMVNKDINMYNYMMTIELYRKNKRNSINLYLEILHKADQDIILYNKIMGVGFRNDEQIAFNKWANKGNNSYVPIHKIDDKYNNEFKIIQDDKVVNDMLDERDDQYDLEHHLNQFKCYNPNSVTGIDKTALTQNDCLSYSHTYKCSGKWDIPCKSNNECPFFNANKNYENNRGGCNNGFCEMPTNVNVIGHHYYDKNQPICYNCQKIGKNKNCKGIKCNQCCEEQKNRHLYPHLKTPDFAFKDDYVPRTNQKDTLAQHQLLPHKLL